MTAQELKTNILLALRAFAKGNLTENSLELFTKLGYFTERRAPLDQPTFEEFQDTYISDQRFNEAEARVNEWKYVDLLFQLSKEEVSQHASLFDTKQVDKTIIETYLFFALELSGEEYNSTELSNITREINRLFPMPVMLLFKYGNKLTFSIINRRLHKRDETKDVLEKVTLIKDISIESPLRAHIEILFDLSFQELLNKHKFANFVELHNAWQKTLDTKELNKRFYSELFNWYLWAIQSVRFPNDVNDDKDDKVYNAESVIRLLTRLIFVWFIKEKNLVPETLFNVKKLKTILKDLKPESEKTSVYYRAILQNLFFATLNTPMLKDITVENKDEKRRFINTLPKSSNDHYLDQTKYRYQDYFIQPDKALELFATIPFLNGGLFECLDFKEGNKEIRFDGFSSTEKRQAFVPDKLFFADEFVLDLNAEYGTKGKKYKVKGLINILDSYKFTIAENTPLEEEIALDPELLGKVFENLLASYNPETQTTARKQTGSFYTPREIVNYMVDESLIAYFIQNLKSSSPDTGEVSEGRRGEINSPDTGEVSEGRRGEINSPDTGEVSEGRRGEGVKKINNLPHLKTFRKALRNNLTPAEAKLWTLLKGKQLEDKKFRRQFSVANYILDFYCPSENLAIELDGQGHFENTQAEYDYERDLFLQYCGIKVLRFENKWVWDNPDGLIEEIKNNFDWKNKQPLSQPAADSSPLQGEQLLETRLRNLFAHTTDLPEFSEAENTALIKAISEAKILDPACGSGAFPMGVLHRLVDLLNKLDPENKRWNELQIQRAIDETAEVYKIEKDSDERKIRLNEIEKAFDLSMNHPNYARKLFLIENCIYGVDIQQIAIQISKLRFFISLMVDQKVNDGKPNRNILSMPNLETKFVAANTLIGLDKPQQMTLMAGDVERLEKELASIRHKIFFTRKYSAKKTLKKKEKEKREELKKALIESGFGEATATQMAGWNPFDPMQSAKFFDPETMFGLNKYKNEGVFDVVIGNPPYVEAKKLKEISQTLRKYYSTYSGTADLYVYFYENGIKNLKPNGTLVFITSNKFIKTSYGENLRKYFTGFLINEIIDFTDVHVFEALVASCIFSITKKQFAKNEITVAFANDTLTSFAGLWNYVAQNKFYLKQSNLSEKIWQLENETKLLLKSKIEEGSITILKTGTINVYRGVTTGYNPAFIIDNEKRIELISEDKANKEIIKPMLQGRNIRKWVYNETSDFIIFTRRGIEIKNYPSIKKHLEAFKQQLEPGTGRKPGSYYWYEIQDNTAYYPEFEKEKIIWGLTSDKWTFAYDNDGNYLPSNGYILTSKEILIKYLLALINSKLIEFYFGFIGIMTAGGAFTLKYETVVEFPIKIISESKQKPFITLVDQILAAKAANPKADTSPLEKQIDDMVYKLYELSEEEIKIIEGNE